MSTSPRMSPLRYIPEDVSAEITAFNRWENFPQAMVISGDGYNKITIGSV
ncbi:hypothetical protein A2U01_0084977, partial [Trifolium medium]|nr:hypothetical protein [Trifolium medium]